MRGQRDRVRALGERRHAAAGGSAARLHERRIGPQLAPPKGDRGCRPGWHGRAAPGLAPAAVAHVCAPGDADAPRLSTVVLSAFDRLGRDFLATSLVIDELQAVGSALLFANDGWLGRPSERLADG